MKTKYIWITEMENESIYKWMKGRRRAYMNDRNEKIKQIWMDERRRKICEWKNGEQKEDLNERERVNLKDVLHLCEEMWK